MADIVFLVDESASTGVPVQSWLANTLVPALEDSNSTQSLASRGVDVRYGLVGFGGHSSGGFAHSHIVDTSTNAVDPLFGSAGDFVTATSTLAANGSVEDGWDAIEHAVAEYKIREGAVPVYVLIQTEDGRRENSRITRAGTLAAMGSNNAVLNVIYNDYTTGEPPNFAVTPFAPFLGNDVTILGIEADDFDNSTLEYTGTFDGEHVAYGYDSNGNGIVGAFYDYIPNQIYLAEEEYVRLAWETGGAVWDASILSGGASTGKAIELADVFTKSIGDQILAADNSGSIYQESVPVFELNVGGGAYGTYSGDDERDGAFLPTSASFSGTTEFGTLAIDTNSIAASTPSQVLDTGRVGVSVDQFQIRGVSGDRVGAEGFVASGNTVTLTLGKEGLYRPDVSYYSASVSAIQAESLTPNAEVVLSNTSSSQAVILNSTDLEGFTFNFLGKQRSTIGISTDGTIAFDDNYPSYTQDIDTQLQGSLPATLLAVFSAPLDTATFGGQVRWEVLDRGTSNERLVVSWEGVSFNGAVSPSDGMSFQASLYHNGVVKMHYVDVEYTDFYGANDPDTIGAVVGTVGFIENYDYLQIRGTNGETLGAAGYVASGKQLLFIPDGDGDFGPSVNGYSAVSNSLAGGQGESLTSAKTSVRATIQTQSSVLLNKEDLGSFRFSFEEQDYSDIHIHANGLITLGDSFASFFPADFGGVQWYETLTPSLGVLWAPISLNGTNADVSWEILGGGGADERLVVEWNSVNYESTPSPNDSITFQAVLYKDGRFAYNYIDVTESDGTNDYTPENGAYGAGAVVGFEARYLEFGSLDYSFENVPDGRYVVELLFRDLYLLHNGENGEGLFSGVFDVEIEGSSVLQSYDPSADYASVNSSTYETATLGSSGAAAKRYEVVVQDGNGLQVRLITRGSFTSGTAAISGIRLLSFEATPYLTADYTRDNVVDAADYSYWRDGYGDWVGRGTGADGSGNGIIDQADYVVWQQNYGATAGLIANYNGDNQVDAADYTVWRDTLGSRTNLAADGNRDGVVDAKDYIIWKETYGSTIANPVFNLITGPADDVYIVSTFDDVVDGDYSPGNLSLREAILLANASENPSVIFLEEGRYLLTRVGSESGYDASYNDLDITGDIRVYGVGAGATVVDVPSYGSSSYTRAFEVAPGKSLLVEGLTLQSDGSGSNGRAIYAGAGSSLTINNAAVVSNTTVGNGAGVYGAGASITVRRSVFTHNLTTYGAGAAIAAYSGGGFDGSLTIGDSIFALNAATFPYGSYPPNVSTSTDVVKVNEGNNLYDNASGGFFNTTPGLGDYLGTPDYVVTSVRDTLNHADDSESLSLREAIDLANQASGAQVIWLPAWAFALTRDRQNYGGASSTDTDIAFGDLDIKGPLTIRGIADQTRIEWKPGVVDSVFDLLGDYNDDGEVDAGDYSVWGTENNSGSGTSADWEVYAADGDDDGDVDTADHTVWSTYYNSSLSLFDIDVL